MLDSCRDENDYVIAADQIISILADHNIRLNEVDEVITIVHFQIGKQFIQKNSQYTLALRK